MRLVLLSGISALLSGFALALTSSSPRSHVLVAERSLTDVDCMCCVVHMAKAHEVIMQLHLLCTVWPASGIQLPAWSPAAVSPLVRVSRSIDILTAALGGRSCVACPDGAGSDASVVAAVRKRSDYAAFLTQGQMKATSTDLWFGRVGHVLGLTHRQSCGLERVLQLGGLGALTLGNSRGEQTQ